MHRHTRPAGIAARLALVAGSVLCVPALGDTILTPYSGSITTYLYTSGTGLQNVRPLVNQRGVHFDGGVRAPNVHGWAKAGNPFGDVEPGRLRIGDVDLANGTYSPTEIDLALPAHVPWVVGRSHNHAQVVSGSHHDSNGPMWYNWFYLGQPELAFYNGATDDLDVIYLVYGADGYLEFKRTGVNDGTFRAVNGAAGVIEYETAENEPDTYVYYDQAGNRTYFFGDNTASNAADWQLWRVVDPAGNIAYVGDSSDPSTAVTNGFNSDKTVAKAYDSVGRRYCHSYSTVGGASRLTQVKVETDAGGGWGDCGTETLVATVDYEYYTADGDDHGKAGDLKLVEVTMPLTDSGINLVRKRYYRYYDAGWTNSNGLRGEPHMIKMVVGEEGTRGHDWGDELFDEDFLTETDANLKAYAEAYLEYVSASDYRVSTVFANGECGCSGGVDGEYAVAYSANGSFSGSSGYDTDWYNRVVVTQPDLICFTQYFDETGQTLSKVVTNADPSAEPTNMWATQVVRDSDGQVTEVRSPANNDTYTHSTGALTAQASTGLITLYERVSGGDTDAFLSFIQHKQGTSGTVYYDAKTEYTDRDLNIAGSVNVTRPMVSARRAYHAAAPLRHRWELPRAGLRLFPVPLDAPRPPYMWAEHATMIQTQVQAVRDSAMTGGLVTRRIEKLALLLNLGTYLRCRDSHRIRSAWAWDRERDDCSRWLELRYHSPEVLDPKAIQEAARAPEGRWIGDAEYYLEFGESSGDAAVLPASLDETLSAATNVTYGVLAVGSGPPMRPVQSLRRCPSSH